MKLKGKLNDIIISDNQNNKNLILNQNSKNILNNNEKELNSDFNKQKIKAIIDINDYELNSLNYKDAIKLDKRSYLQYYWSLIKAKQLLIFTFYNTKDYNSYIIKIELFLFSFALYLTVNALFFTENKIHTIYEEEGIFNFINNLPQIIYSTVISSVINFIIKTLSLTEKTILEIKQEKNQINLDEKVLKVINRLKLKFILYYIVSNVFLIFFWFYISCFCAVYRNTQYHLIKDTLLSFTLSLLYPFIINIFPILLRIPALRSQNNECLYKFSKVIQII